MLEEHAERGDTMIYFSLALLVVALALVGLHFAERRDDRRRLIIQQRCRGDRRAGGSDLDRSDLPNRRSRSTGGLGIGDRQPDLGRRRLGLLREFRRSGRGVGQQCHELVLAGQRLGADGLP